MVERVQRMPLADQAAALLLDRIRDGEWKLGAKLPGETTLAPQLGVGRSTVREAIRQLAGRGVLTTRQGAGVFVAALDAPQDRADMMRRASIITVIEARIAVETEAASLAARRRTPAQLRAIRKALVARAGAVESVPAYVDADLDFHRAIVVAAANEILTDLFDLSTPRMREAMIDMLAIRGEYGGEADRDAHAELVEAVADRRPDAASQASRTHLTDLKETLA
ncbi:FadR/GntR family transcriptional regulator [Gordonia liuliyuniae]|uniref:FadR family transcriptional regulator n=1 Tax=Gordonia liuliyuniae TaxID=2911517 RepID=A0ABS9IQ64_9ACTN|nr:FadR/GntR family transcriptional regulator [Gordonia liuliyuniae]MCF8587698.1 FadR family transcriptional regulator [Gordonia liuliyuniae]